MMEKIIVLHEVGAPEHYQGLTELALKKGVGLERREFRFVRQIARGILNADLSLILRGISNGLWLLAAWMGAIRDQRIVLGIAPFDWRILILLPIILNNTIYWHTSWPYWGGLEGTRYPRRIRSSVVKNAWRYFIDFKLHGIFFVTECAQNNFRRSFGVTLPTWVVYHSFNPTYFFSRYRPATDVITVGFAGRLELSKGVAQVFSISKMLADLPFKFVIAGSGSMRADVELEAVKSNGRLSYMGHMRADHLGELYRSIDFLLVPSIRTAEWEEAFGMVIVEAMACGVVPIATNHPGPSEILSGELAANVFSEEQFQEGAVGVLLRARSEPEYLDKLSVAAKQLSLAYTTSSISKKWSAIV